MARTLIAAGARVTPDLAKLLDDRAKRNGKVTPADAELRKILSENS